MECYKCDTSIDSTIRLKFQENILCGQVWTLDFLFPLHLSMDGAMEIWLQWNHEIYGLNNAKNCSLEIMILKN